MRTAKQSSLRSRRTKGEIGTPFIVSENERRGSEFRHYRVFGHGIDRKVYCLAGTLEACVVLEPVAYGASVKF